MIGVCSFCFVGPELPKVEGGEPDLSLSITVIFVTPQTTTIQICYLIGMLFDHVFFSRLLYGAPGHFLTNCNVDIEVDGKLS